MEKLMILHFQPLHRILRRVVLHRVALPNVVLPGVVLLVSQGVVGCAGDGGEDPADAGIETATDGSDTSDDRSTDEQASDSDPTDDHGPSDGGPTDEDPTDDELTDDDPTDDELTDTESDAAAPEDTDPSQLDEAGAHDTDAGLLLDGGADASDSGVDASAPEREDGGFEVDAGTPDGGSCGPGPTTAVSSDAASAAPGCFPECIDELQARCGAAGSCGTNFGDVEVSCWDNGLRLVNSFDVTEEGYVSVNSVYVGNELCYSVEEIEPFSGDTSYRWKNHCGIVVASATPSQEDPTLRQVSCTGSGTSQTVDLSQAQCEGVTGGYPAVSECAEDDECSP